MNKEQEELFAKLFEGTEDFIIVFQDKGIPDEDLHQERALVIAEYINDNSHAGKEEVVILEEIKASFNDRIAALMDEDKAQEDLANKILKRVNKVNDAAIKYNEDFFVKPTPAELASYLGVTEEYILDTIQMSGYEITEIDFDAPAPDKKDG